MKIHTEIFTHVVLLKLSSNINNWELGKWKRFNLTMTIWGGMIYFFMFKLFCIFFSWGGGEKAKKKIPEN